MRSFGLVFTKLILFLPLVTQAEGLTTRYLGLNIEGGVTGGYFYSSKTYTPGVLTNGLLVNDNADNILLNDLMLEIKSEKSSLLGASMNAGFGNMKMLTVLDGNGNYALNTTYLRTIETASASLSTDRAQELIDRDDRYAMDIYYGFVSIAPLEDAFIEVGRLATHLGYEVAPSYANWNTSLGLLWASQPTYYPGVRMGYRVGELKIYAEYNEDTSVGGNRAWAGGVYGQMDNVRFSMNYFDGLASRNTIDAMAELKLSFVTLATNVDYIIYDSGVRTGSDTQAWGIALYAIPHFDKYFFPIRYDYFWDGDTDILGVHHAYSITITPTMYLNENTFIRTEFAFVSSSNAVFRSVSDGSSDFTKWEMSAQAGFYF